ncbi:Uracil-DNA glycosylase superfamily [Thermaerobacter marianensis DSM 12885]|uniref:Type-5 uracil-DNA glycosylase n=1 Tax=Thermaerobacter marianensis (strain ATCC 700841 / DSM 12885 / JCM 10246 / 7p75a) TaxID=644966 RepID=E6SH33_THEM7|nr:uracil-DNA glycosylase [Thermaerobacter marianensis]ADU50664.1 Uracil-DNA glycosylase superfamily [Thermaerobacter marianensis DSM 12885]
MNGPLDDPSFDADKGDRVGESPQRFGSARDQVDQLARINRDIVACRRCPRLVAYTAEVARTKRRAYRDWDYWGRPVPSFGDPLARLLIVGLAPAAHGANRTGRMFTGDSSGDWLYRALYRAGFASQPTSTHRDDGLELRDAYITATCHCAPPDNRPSRDELAACSAFLARELEALATVRVIVCLGQIAFQGVLRLMRERGYGWPREVDPSAQGHDAGAAGSSGTNRPTRPAKPRFRHGGEYRWYRPPERPPGPPRPDLPPPPVLLASYHPSRQNTQTGVLTEAMFDAVFRRARQLLDRESSGRERPGDRAFAGRGSTAGRASPRKGSG